MKKHACYNFRELLSKFRQRHTDKIRKIRNVGINQTEQKVMHTDKKSKNKNIDKTGLNQLQGLQCL
jgi:hypothetical protein